MDYSNVSHVAQSYQNLTRNLLYQVMWHLGLISPAKVLVQIFVQYLRDNKKVSPKFETIVELEDAVFVCVSLV